MRRTCPHLAALLAGETPHDHVLGVGELHGSRNVAAVATAAQRQQDVAVLGVVSQLLGEDLVETVVVADGCQPRRARREIMDAEAAFRADPSLPIDQLAGEVLGNVARDGCHSSVTDNKDLAVFLESLQQVAG